MGTAMTDLETGSDGDSTTFPYNLFQQFCIALESTIFKENKKAILLITK